MMKIKKAIQVLGWILFWCMYSGLIVLFLWWLIEIQGGDNAWNGLSVLAKIGVVIGSVAAVCVYSIVMFFFQMLFESLFIWITKKILGMREDIKKMKNKNVTRIN